MLWLLASLSFVASLGFVWLAWFWIYWGSDGNLHEDHVSPFNVLISLVPVVSATIAAFAYRGRSRAAWPPILIILFLPLFWAAAPLFGE